MDIAHIQQQISEASANNRAAPVEDWNPNFCGNMDLCIKRNGQWWSEGTPFTRASLIRLLSSVIKYEDNQYYLVTPAEKVGIQVEDVPFIIIDANFTNNQLVVNTQTGEQVVISKIHPVELRKYDGQWLPYCLVRRNLWARVHQNVLYRWIDSAIQKQIDNQLCLYLTSGDYHFCIGRIDNT